MAEKRPKGGLTYEEWKKRYGQKEKLRLTLYAPDLETRESWEKAADEEGIALTRWILNRLEAGKEKLEKLEAMQKDLRAHRDMTEKWRQKAEQLNAELVRLESEKAALERKVASLEAAAGFDTGVGEKPWYILEIRSLLNVNLGMGVPVYPEGIKPALHQAYRKSVYAEEKRTLSKAELKAIDEEVDRILTTY